MRAMHGSDEKRGPLSVEVFTLGPWGTNCYLLHTGAGGEGWIVDASFEPGPIVRRASELGLAVKAIVLTHAHVDHIAGLTEVRTAFPDAEVLIHRAEEAWLGDPMLNLSEGAGMPVTSSPPDRLLAGGETLHIGGPDGYDFDVLHTPGHSPGGVALHCPAAHVAIVGDTLFAGSIGRSDFPTSDPDALFDSILRVLYALPDETVVLPGHGQRTTIGREKQTNPFVRAHGVIA